MLWSIKTRNGNIDSLTTNEITALASIQGNDNFAQVQARLLLEQGNIRTYQEPIPIHTPNMQLRKAPKATKSNSSDAISILPNPASDYTTLQSDIILENATIAVHDMTGKLVYQNIIQNAYSATFSVKDWANGIYTYHITNDNTTIAQGKFSVLK